MPYAQNEVVRLVPDLFVYKKALHKIKASGQNLSFNLSWWTFTWTYNKTNLITVLIRKLISVDPEIFSISIFYKRVSPSHFGWFFKKIFLNELTKLHYLVSLLFEILDNMCITITCCWVSAINFENYPSFHIMPFFK